MGTRSLTHIHEDDGSILLTFYKQHDGYPEGWGRELAEFLAPFHIVNGLKRDDSNIANGMGCLAAQIIAKFKDGPGQFYICPAASKDCGEEFTYHILPGAPTELAVAGSKWPRQARSITLRVHDGERVIFEGLPSSFPRFLATLNAET